jgi:hypothetical protein
MAVKFLRAEGQKEGKRFLYHLSYDIKDKAQCRNALIYKGVTFLSNAFFYNLATPIFKPL